MKQIAMISCTVLLLIFSVNSFLDAQVCNDYDWTMENIFYESASSTWSICPESIEFEVTALSSQFTSAFFLCGSYFTFVQGSSQFEVLPYHTDDTAYIHFDGNFDGCSDLKIGVKVTGWVDRFPNWFDIFSPFRIYYYDSYVDVDGAPTATTTSATTSVGPTTTSSITGSNIIIKDHMMTKKPISGCLTPTQTGTFSLSDTRAYCWAYYENAVPSEEIKCKWYKQNGTLYDENGGSIDYDEGCFACGLSIRGNLRESSIGAWYVDVSIGGEQLFTEYFEIVDADAEPCPMSLIYGEDSEQAEMLRSFRDNVLKQTPEGHELIKLYYLWSPIIVRTMEQDEEFKEEVKQMIDGVLPMIEDAVE